MNRNIVQNYLDIKQKSPPVVGSNHQHQSHNIIYLRCEMHLHSLSLDPIHIVCAADANYGRYAGITMSSVIESNLNSVIHLHLLSDGVKKKDIKRFELMAQTTGNRFSYYDLSSKLSSLPRNPRIANHLNRTAYSRLLLSDCVPDYVQQAIYLDCDVICTKNLLELWHFGKTVPLIAAARDPWLDRNLELKRFLGICPDATYFNSGVLVVNVEAWRRRRIGDQLYAFMAGPIKTKNADQDVINAVLGSEILEFSQCWNRLVSLPDQSVSESTLKSAAHLHYVGGFKPWHLGYSFAVRTEVESFLKAKLNSPWRWTLPDLHIGRVRKKVQQLTGGLLRRQYREQAGLEHGF